MIAMVSGDAVAVTDDSIVLLVGGVGLQILAPVTLLAEIRVGQSVTVHTSLVVREDSLTLFGFANANDRGVFEQLQSVSGVGPRTALAALTVFSAAELSDVVVRGDERALMKIPGIGRKGAQRLILELSGKLVVTSDEQRPPNGFGANNAGWYEQVRQGLVSLGWSAKEADAALDVVTHDEPIDSADGRSDQDRVADMLAKALRVMGRK
jgi:Holliday junction DNA helicase RuvA